MSDKETYDVFLSHSHTDASLVEALAHKLEGEAGLRVWLDQWVLVPGDQWLEAMADGLEQARACVVCIGAWPPDGWQKQEMYRALNRRARDAAFRVIPLLLPGAQTAFVDDFLELGTWVDLRGGLNDTRAVHRLISGIRGVAPGRGPREDRQPQRQQMGQQSLRDAIHRLDSRLARQLKQVWQTDQARTPHARTVEETLSALIPDVWKGTRFAAIDLFVLSAAAALHDPHRSESSHEDDRHIPWWEVRDRAEA